MVSFLVHHGSVETRTERDVEFSEQICEDWKGNKISSNKNFGKKFCVIE